MAISHLYPDERPALSLNFARSKVIDSRVSITRATTATFLGGNGLIQTAAAGEGRIDHDGGTGECLGLLIEESRTNLIKNSVINSSNWNTGTGATLTNNTSETTAPDGTSTAAKYVGTGGMGSWVALYDTGDAISLTNNVQYTYSLFAKPTHSDKTIFVLRGDIRDAGGIDFSVDFDLSGDGSVDAEFGSPDSSSIEKYPNGWYRVIVTATSTASTTEEPGFSEKTSGDGTKGFYVWGYQVEQGAFVTSHIPTSGSTVTRNADVAKISGTDFSDFFNSSEGTFVARLPAKTPAEGFIADVGNNSTSGSAASGYILKYVASSNNASGDSRVNDGSTALVEVSVTGSNVDLVFAYEENNFNTAVNGTLGTADTSGAVPTLGAQQVFLGSRFNSQAIVNTPISSFVYYNTRLTDTQIQALSR